MTDLTTYKKVFELAKKGNRKQTEAQSFFDQIAKCAQNYVDWSEIYCTYQAGVGVVLYTAHHECSFNEFFQFLKHNDWKITELEFNTICM